MSRLKANARPPASTTLLEEAVVLLTNLATKPLVDDLDGDVSETFCAWCAAGGDLGHEADCALDAFLRRLDAAKQEEAR